MSVIVVFRGNEILASGTDTEGPYEQPIPAGEIILVKCLVDTVGGEKGRSIGVTRVEVLRGTVVEPMKFRNLYSIHLPKGISLTPLPVRSLNDEQRTAVKQKVKGASIYWLGNATMEAKLALGVEVSDQDKAQELMRQGLEQFSQGSPIEAARLVQAGLEIMPKLRGAKFTLGEIALESGKVDEAFGWFEQETSLAYSGYELDAYRFLEAICRARDDEAGALRYARAASGTRAYIGNPSFLDPGLIVKIRSIMAGTWKPVSWDDGQGSRVDKKKKWWEFWK